jgi:S-adenosylmethionine:tRNA ribosyltransferase-isomerase
MHLNDFDYDLPPELIAQAPAEPRDASRMMVLDYQTGGITDSQFRSLPDFLGPSDILVLNDTRVIRARTRARLERGTGSTREIEVFFVEPVANQEAWQVLCKPGRRIRPGDKAVFGGGVVGTFRDSLESDLHLLEIEAAEQLLSRFGEIPLPPYIQRPARTEDVANYQTVFGANSGAIAAPTAGLHFTPNILETIRSRSVEVVSITLHVGIGTFLPVRTEDPEKHTLRAERYNVGTAAAAQLQKAVTEGRRVIAVGTTTTRTLEFLMLRDGRIQAGSGYTDLYILPGFRFRIVQGLLTNFHLPKSTLLMLVSAFAGREGILSAYRHAIREGYRFYSYGDCMFIQTKAMSL